MLDEEDTSNYLNSESGSLEEALEEFDEDYDEDYAENHLNLMQIKFTNETAN